MNQLNNGVKEIILNQEQIDILIEHSTKSHPNESCAMLLGTHDDQQWNVKEVFLTNNMENQRQILQFHQRSSFMGINLQKKNS